MVRSLAHEPWRVAIEMAAEGPVSCCIDINLGPGEAAVDFGRAEGDRRSATCLQCACSDDRCLTGMMNLNGVQCSLGESVKAGRSVLKVKAAGKNCVLASLMADKIESSVLELMFEEVSIRLNAC